MGRKTTTTRKALTLALLLAVSSFSTLINISAFAQSAKAAGELSLSGTVTINGTAAISGATIFSESKIKTLQNGAAVVNLGRLGRVELGPDTEMTLRFANGSVGGNLYTGRATVSAPTGVAVSVTTADGIATADGKEAALLTVDVTCGALRVAAARSDATVTAGAKVERVVAGSEVAVSQDPAKPKCARLAAIKENKLSRRAIAALILLGVGGAVAGIIAGSQNDDPVSGVVVSGVTPGR